MSAQEVCVLEGISDQVLALFAWGEKGMHALMEISHPTYLY